MAALNNGNGINGNSRITFRQPSPSIHRLQPSTYQHKNETSFQKASARGREIYEKNEQKKHVYIIAKLKSEGFTDDEITGVFGVECDGLPAVETPRLVELNCVNNPSPASQLRQMKAIKYGRTLELERLNPRNRELVKRIRNKEKIAKHKHMLDRLMKEGLTKLEAEDAIENIIGVIE
jgi:hypothetical protein